MISFLLKSSFVIVLLLAFYKIVLEKESFFSKNRWYLLGCLFLTFLLPFLTLPELVNNQGIVSTTIEKHIEKEPIDLASTPILEDKISEAPISKQEINNNTVTENLDNETKTNKTIESPTPPISTTTKSEKKGVLYWLLMIYLFGVVIFSLNFISQIASVIFKVIKSDDKIEDMDCTIINSPKMTEPCSFFKYIFINPESYDYETYEQILAHERVHVKLNHTWDLILSEIVVIVMWFNPFAWILRKEIEKNIEYQTDDYLLSEEKLEKEAYQMNLLKVATYSHPLTVVTNYNQSLIKQRILRINAKKSSFHSYWKYAFIAPLLFGISLLLNRPDVLAQASMPMEVADTPDTNIEKGVQQNIPQKENIVKQKKEIPSTTPAIAENNNSQKKGKVVTTITTTTVTTNDNEYSDCQNLIKTVIKNDIAQLKKLLKTVDPNCIDRNPDFIEYKEDGNTYSKQEAATPLTAAARYGHFELGKLLVEAGAKINLDAGHGETPLIAASGAGHMNFVKYLLENKANINKNSNGFGTALNAAAKQGHQEVVEYLIANGANIKKSSNGQGSALVAAAGNGELEIIKFLLEQGADINAATNGQGSALTRAAGNGELEVVKYLLEHGAAINARTNGNGSALTQAAGNGELKVVKYLLEKGADIEGATNGNGSALTQAAANGELEVLKYLLEQGADINARTDGQGTAFEAASRNGELEVLKYLISQGASN